MNSRPHSHRTCIAVATCLCAVAVMVGAAPAEAAFPGANGKVAYYNPKSGDDHIYTVDPDTGTSTQLPIKGVDPQWSPDGAKLLYNRGTQIWIANADGTGERALASIAATTGGFGNRVAAWSPDGRQVVFTRNTGTRARMGHNGDAIFDLFVINADGTDERRLTADDNRNEYFPSWSPKGDKIAFTTDYWTSTAADSWHQEIGTIGADGQGLQSVNHGGNANTTGDAYQRPDWSPDGTALVFDCSVYYGAGKHQSICRQDGLGAPRVIVSSQGALDPVFSPDGQKVAYVESFPNYRVYTAPAAGGAGTVLTPAPFALGPSWRPKSTPIIFIHGFLGSKIRCGGDEAWPNLPAQPHFAAMSLAADGVSSPCTVPEGEAGIVQAVAGAHIYDHTVDFLKRAAPGYQIFSWDWRKSPEQAIADLDKLIDTARGGPNGKVVLMAHSMGGLVTRWYIDDAQRAKKVERAVTIGTPYWGSPKALFPLAAGIETPGASMLDNIIVNSLLQGFARNLQGAYFLWPSERYGPWLDVAGIGPGPLSQAGVLAFVHSVLDGNRTLLANAYAAHAQHLDQLRLNGVDYQIVVGTGLNTIGGVSITPLLDGTGIYALNWTNGDGTVPLDSARLGTSVAADRLHFVCGVGHVDLPGDPTVTKGIEDFLLKGKPIADLNNNCLASGFQFQEVNPIALGSSSARVTAGGSGELTLDQAQERQLIERLDLGVQDLFATDADRPVRLKLKGKQLAFVVTPLENGKEGKPRYFGPVSGDLVIDAAAKAKLTANGKRLRPRKRPDRRPPRTRVEVTEQGSRAVLRFRAKDASGVAVTYAKVGKGKARRVKRKLRVKKSSLGKVRFQSIDVFGNVERERRPKGRAPS